MDYFRFVPPSIISYVVASTVISVVTALPMAFPQQPSARFLPNLFQSPTTNPNQNLQNSLAAGGLGLVGGVAATQCLSGRNCDLSFRPSLGAAFDADGNFVPQLGLTTQIGDGPVAPTFTGGLQLDGVGGQQGPQVGTFVAGGFNNGNANGGFSPGLQTGFGFSANGQGQTQATSQLGGSIQAPQFAGVNFGGNQRPGSIGGAQPTLFNQPLFSLFQG